MHIRGYNVDGYWWLGLEVNGRVMLIRRVGRVGDCVRF